MASDDTRTKLLDGALDTVVRNGIAKTSARSIAAAAGVNQGLIFYHFGSVDELLAAACRYGAEQSVLRYRDRFAAVRSFDDLARLGRELHEAERGSGHPATLGQLLTAAPSREWLAEATTAGLRLWTRELEAVLARLLPRTPLEGLVDARGLATALAAGFVGLELYEGADREGAERAFTSLEELGRLAAVLDDLGPVTRTAVRARLRAAARDRA
ncbi:TetR/AcrR family transcriptional regulator [Nocardiopsis suaedae]|uniref:TetR/AcrR family transcriptional regulator n=1 Tax=Nocardiopsis suaedae TaxID=3018444 RepID=A0ABT4TQV1_9ACTN|nr:TetR/AcrR family transcriptional regulator [Nocardiopsis suaedae]MDA2807069.1 TetR/AcrR family transcriptional regulator [Nocardiopsis suaedae]